jgi:hypothetical protein
MANLLNRARMSTATTGTGTVTLGSAVTKYLTFSEAGAVNATTYPYVIEDGNDFEQGIGTYTSSGTTFSRDTVTVSKIAGTAGTSKMNLSGTAEIFLTPRAADIGSVTSVASGTGLTGGPITGTGTLATSLSTATNSLGSNTAIANGSYTDGPSCAQGTSGTWYASGTVTIKFGASSIIALKLWDGTTVISSLRITSTASGVYGYAPHATSVWVILASPAGDIFAYRHLQRRERRLYLSNSTTAAIARTAR